MLHFCFLSRKSYTPIVYLTDVEALRAKCTWSIVAWAGISGNLDGMYGTYSVAAILQDRTWTDSLLYLRAYETVSFAVESNKQAAARGQLSKGSVVLNQ